MDDKKLHIAMMGHKHMLSREGGIEVAVYELATRMVAHGYSVICYDRGSSHISGGKLDECGEYRGVRIRRVWTIPRKGLAAVTASFCAAVRASVSSADVVHIHAEGPAVISRIPKLAGKKVVVTVHGLDWVRAKWSGFAAKYIKWGEIQAVKYADEIIVLSENLREYFKREYGRDTAFIPNGVERPEIREAAEITEKWGLEKNGYVLFVGRIVPEKGLQYLLDAWKGLRTEKKLVIAGGSSDTQEFMRQLKRDAGDVIFTGFQQGRVLEELYSNCFLYVLPSDLEGMPLSLLEAMSYGNCCVVSDIPECVEVVSDKAVTFRKSDAGDLRRTLQALLDDEERVNAYRRNAADFICNKYNWDDVVDRTLELYRK